MVPGGATGDVGFGKGKEMGRCVWVEGRVVGGGGGREGVLEDSLEVGY